MDWIRIFHFISCFGGWILFIAVTRLHSVLVLICFIGSPENLCSHTQIDGIRANFSIKCHSTLWTSSTLYAKTTRWYIFKYYVCDPSADNWIRTFQFGWKQRNGNHPELWRDLLPITKDINFSISGKYNKKTFLRLIK